jgi:hypothetical protein
MAWVMLTVASAAPDFGVAVNRVGGSDALAPAQPSLRRVFLAVISNTAFPSGFVVTTVHSRESRSKIFGLGQTDAWSVVAFH